MFDYTGWIVRSDAGRDRGDIFCVLGVDRERGLLLLADGRRRRVERPKRKKLGHVTALTGRQNQFPHPVIQELKKGNAPSNRALRRALAAFRAETRRV